MRQPLTRFFARKQLEALLPHLAAGLQDITGKLVETLGEDGRAQVKALHAALFPLSTTASANAALNRLLTTLNKVARAREVPVEVKITADKKGGPTRRWVWCEGEATLDAVPYTGDLYAVPENRRQRSQRGLAIGRPLVLMTFNEHEATAVAASFASGGPHLTDTSGTYLMTDLGLHGAYQVFHLVSGQGPRDAQDAAAFVIAKKRPAAVIALGIAFGIDSEKQRIGDVLVATCVRDYDAARVNSDGSRTPRGDRPPASDYFLKRLRHLDHMRGQASTLPRLRFGPLLCGASLIDHRPTRDALLEIEPEAIGGEMEGSGIERACRSAGTDWMVVKGICDFADGDKGTRSKEDDQRLAAGRAAQVVKALLTTGGEGPPGGPRPDAADPRAAKPSDRAAMLPRPVLPDHGGLPEGHFQSGAMARRIGLEKRDLEHHAVGGDEQPGEEVLPFIHRWMDDAEGPPLLALLAEYGMGKTITCQQVATELAEARRREGEGPIPLYFDLRLVTLRKGRVPSLAEALADCMERGWHSLGDGSAVTLEQVNDWIDQGALVLFDGLDEVLVKLDAQEGQIFTNGLLKLLSDARVRAQAAGRPCRLKMIVACRTAYFPTLRAQQTHFTQEERGEFGPRAYAALLLLPWDEAQIRAYLAVALPGLDPERVLETIGQVHNLEELAERPFTLKLVADYIPEIERLRAAGRPVQGVTLYRAMARRWLERDQGKHRILPEHKLRLVAHLAAHLWTGGRGDLPAEDLQAWFHQWRAEQPELRRYEALSVDQLEEDLRTATFLSRRDEGRRSAFRFAHTSLQEFFLAEFLLRAAAEDRPEDWAIRVPSQETLDFLGQLFAEGEEPEALRHAGSWRRQRRPGTNELLLAYALRARARGWPVPNLHGIDLSGAKLHGLVLDGRPDGWSLGPARLDGCDLREARLFNLTLDDASFTDALLGRAVFQDCRLRGARLEGAEFPGTVFRRCALAESDWTGAQGYRTQLQHCTGDEAVTSLPLLPDAGPAILRLPDSAQPVGTRLAVLTAQGGQSCAWSPEGHVLAGACYDGTLCLWDSESGEAVAVLTGHVGQLGACAWSPDGRILASGGFDGTLRLWDVKRGEAKAVLIEHTGSVQACAWSPDGRLLASGGSDRTLCLWEVESGALRTVLTGHAGSVQACAWSPDGRFLASGGFDGTLRLWEVESGAAGPVLTGHGGWVQTCAWSPDGRVLASGGADGSLLLWDVESGLPLAVLNEHAGSVQTCAWSPDGRILASANSGSVLYLGDVESGKSQVILTGHVGQVEACAWSPDGRVLASAGDDDTLRLWDVDTGAPRAILTGHDGSVEACAWSPDGRVLASAGYEGVLRLWDAKSGTLHAVLIGHKDWVRACAWSPDGCVLASAGYDGSLRLWDAKSAALRTTLTVDADAVEACVWSPDGGVVTGVSSNGSLHLWDAKTCEALAVLAEHEGWVRACAWSPDGGVIAGACSDGSLRLWTAESGETLAVMTGHNDSAHACAWSPDGRVLASAGNDGALRLWDVETGEPLAVLTGHEGWTHACAWSPGGRVLASAGNDGTLRLWDAESGVPRSVLTGHEGWVQACAWSPDGRVLASAGSDGTLRLWDLATGACTRIHTAWSEADFGCGHAVWDPQTNRLLSASDNAWRYLYWQGLDETGRLNTWPLETAGSIADLTGRAGDSPSGPTP
ncbi:MAG: hypothetical protein Kilf2KO_06960 [Rhodospirillales bacterium]